jgi:hemoglobin/transferrin/lactoferrin receptor protein
MNMESSTWIKRSIISIAVASALLSNVVIAEENKDVDTTTVIGESTSLLDVTIDQDTLEKSQANDLRDIFKNEVSVSVGGSSTVSQKIYVRDLESNMLNVSIDGAKQSASIFHHQGSISIEPELLKKVEVQAGAGSALTGPGALGGSLNFTTKDPGDLLDSNERFGALIKGSYSNNANAYKTSVSLYGELTDNWSAMGTIVQTESDNYQDGDGNEVEYTDYKQQNGLIKVVGNFKNNQRLSVSFDDRIDDGERLLKPNWTITTKNSGIEQEAERETSKIEYSINPEDNQWLALKVNAYNTVSDLYRPIYDDNGTVETYGFDIRNTNKIYEHSFTYGVDYHNDNSSFNEGNSASRTDESDVYGLYLQAEIQLAQSWLLNLGGRYDTYKTTDADSQSFESEGFSPNVSIQFKPSTDLKLELGYAQAMRGVEVRETFLIYDGGYTNSSDLKEEIASNIEFSIDYQLNNNLGLSAKAYHSKIDDVITYGEYGDSDYKEFNNDGELVTEGASLSINYNWQALQTSVSYNHSTSELNGEPLGDYYDTDLGNSTGDTINTSINYQVSESLEFGWNARFTTHLSDVADGFKEKVGYGVHDVYGQWLPLNDDSLKVTLSISNLFDKQYLDQSTFGVSDYNDYGDLAPGRDFKLAVAWAL